MYGFSNFPNEIDFKNEKYKQNISPTDKLNIDLGKNYLVDETKVIEAQFVNRLMDALRSVESYSLQLESRLKKVEEGQSPTPSLKGNIIFSGDFFESTDGNVEVVE